ncbi:hypothetical protein HDU91_006520, partial [Kappamyces sp. JEL0680]
MLLFEFVKIFPTNTKKFKDPVTFDIRTSISKTKFDARIQMLYALAMCFGLPEALNDYFLAYIDRLMASILANNSHALIQSAVLQILAKYLPQTNRNRARIEQFYRSHVNHLLDLHEGDGESPKPNLVYLLSSLHYFVSV